MPTAHGAVLRWVFAVDPAPELAEIIAAARDTIGGVFTSAMTGLAAHLDQPNA